MNKIRADIEINTNCNARCVFCPQRFDPKGKNVMSMECFEKVIDFLVFNGIKFVSLNHYGEPLLDKFVTERIDLLSYKKIKVAFFSNMISVRNGVIEHIANSDNIYDFFINLPSIDRYEWSDLTGVDANLHKIVVENIILISKYCKGNVNILVCGSDLSQQNRVGEIKNFFDLYGKVNVKAIQTNSRGGLLRNKYVNNDERKKNNTLCNHRFGVVNISVNSDIFMCCQDYYQKYLIGYNIESYYDKNCFHENIDNLIRINKDIGDQVICNDCPYQSGEYAITPEFL